MSGGRLIQKVKTYTPPDMSTDILPSLAKRTSFEIAFRVESW
jgi:hypothetical protein